ncbi:P-loop NTPase family protein [Candidatus Nitrospira nitrificans]|nr:DNA topology modulation protein FlaR [Candidatus Nitrospira nitrificans]
MVQRIHILGGPGSGKTYAAGRLSRMLQIPAHDLDGLFWDVQADRYGRRAAEDGRDTKLAGIARQEQWIVEGVYYTWLKPVFERADLIAVLQPHVFMRDLRIVRRFGYRKLGISTSKQEGFGDLYRLLLWNHQYDTANLKRAMECIEPYVHKFIHCRSADELVSRVLKSVNQSIV